MKEQELNMIETKEYQLTEKEYFKIIYLNHLKRSKALFIFVALLSAYFFMQFIISGFDIKCLLFFFFAFAIETTTIIYYYFFFAKNKDNKIIYLKRKLEFNTEKAIILLDDNLAGEITFNYLVRIVDRKNYWLLYFNKSNFHYIPKNIFNSIDDYNQFKKLMTEKSVTARYEY